MLPKIKSKHCLIMGAFIVLFIYLFPYIWLGHDANILIHDYLDSGVVYNKIIAESGMVFASGDAIVPNMMNGMPRHIYGSEFSVMKLLYYLFEPYTAIALNQVFMRFIAFIGLLLLLKRHFLKSEEDHYVAVGVALVFALLPFYPNAALSVAGQPLALYAFLNIRAYKHRFYDWLIIIIIPFYASFVLSFFFFLLMIFVIFLYDLFRTRKFNRYFFMALIVMSTSFLLADYRLVYSIFIDSGFISHRSDWVFKGDGFRSVIKNSIDMFLNGQYHAATHHRLFMIPASLMGFTILLIKELKNKLIILLIITAIIAGVHGMWGWSGFVTVRDHLGLLGSFQFNRFYFLLPLLWYLIFALSLNLLNEHAKRYGKYIVIAFIVFQSFYLFYQHENIQQRNNPSFKEFYATGLFEDIDQFIGKEKDSYRVVSIGMHPSISQYNGFFTLDGYLANYPLSYKYQFREIIEKELDKNDNLKLYFDNWGSRCYVFVDELHRNSMATKEQEIVIHNLELNTLKLYEMGGRYIFSAVEIANYEENNLLYLRSFESNEYAWIIHLYEVGYY